ncbi:hypothetical protein GN244_ATG17643 [Phytophthora infestans]|uniref:Uncharacterized protein n=1 Tax=Phytophthora infestans TaxID=4787 RepID=A0A833SS37_PHYIN|nr:hypothetical protein GN244_ATG17643 [Phytophthora infestans]
MEITFEDKNVLEYASGTKTLASNATDEEKSKFKEGQVKVMMKKTGTEMWKYLMDTYEGTANAATRTNQEIILYNKLQAAKCKPNWDARLHVNNMFLIKEQLAAINADVRDPIFVNLLIRSLPANPRFDRLRGMVEIGTSEWIL